MRTTICDWCGATASDPWKKGEPRIAVYMLQTNEETPGFYATKPFFCAELCTGCWESGRTAVEKAWKKAEKTAKRKGAK